MRFIIEQDGVPFAEPVSETKVHRGTPETIDLIITGKPSTVTVEMTVNEAINLGLTLIQRSNASNNALIRTLKKTLPF